MQHQEFFEEYQSYSLFGQYWIPNGCKAMVLLVHGMGEYSSRYKESVIPELLAKHIGVFTYDNFGHGNSSGKRGDCPGYDALLEVLDAMFLRVQGLKPKIPLFLYGHSMGGNLVINYVLRKAPEISGAILTSPFLKIAFKPPIIKMAAGRILHKIAPSVTLATGLEVKAISRNPKAIEQYKKDLQIHNKISPNFSFPVMDAGEWAIENATSLKKDVLILHGTGDRITSYKASKAFCDNTEKASLELFDNGYHELHNDLEKDRFISTVIRWIQSKS